MFVCGMYVCVCLKARAITRGESRIVFDVIFLCKNQRCGEGYNLVSVSEVLCHAIHIDLCCEHEMWG